MTSVSGKPGEEFANDVYMLTVVDGKQPWGLS